MVKNQTPDTVANRRNGTFPNDDLGGSDDEGDDDDDKESKNSAGINGAARDAGIDPLPPDELCKRL